MAEFDFVETDSSKIYTAIVGALMDSVGEPLYPGDERRIFAEALVSVFVSIFSDFNDNGPNLFKDNFKNLVGKFNNLFKKIIPK